MHQSLSSSSLVPFFQQNLTHETKPHHKGPSKTHTESFDPKDGEETGAVAKTPAMTANNVRFTGGTLTWEPTFQCYLCFGEGLKAHVKPSRPGGKKPHLSWLAQPREEKLQVLTHKCVHRPDGKIPVLSLKHFSWLVCNTKAWEMPWAC